MKVCTKNFALGSIVGAVAVVAIVAAASAPIGILGDFSLRASESFGHSVAVLHGFEQCQAENPRSPAMAGKELRAQQASLVECFSAWSADPSAEKTARLAAWLPEGLANASSMPLGINMVGARDKAVALSAFNSARPAQDAFGGAMLMSLLSSSQEGASPEEAQAAAAKARELLPRIKIAALKERREAVEFANSHRLAAAAFKLAGKGPIEEAIAPSMAPRALSAYWMTQHFEEVSTIGDFQSSEGKAKLEELRGKAKAWADAEWSSLAKAAGQESEPRGSKT